MSNVKPRSATEVQRAVEHAITSNHDNRELLAVLEPLTQEPAFGGLTWWWGPQLYRRDTVRFRPFILSHFADWAFEKNRFRPVRWTGTTGRELERWLAEVDQADDTALFRRLLAWRLRGKRGWGLDEVRWRQELLDRVERAGSPARRAVELDKMNLWCPVDEATACSLYELDATATRDFILQHLPFTGGWGGGKRRLWEELLESARQHGDEQLARTLYSRQVPVDRWRKDALALCAAITDREKLVNELEAIHPTGYGLDLGKAFLALVETRQRDVLPYLRRHLTDVYSHWRRSGYDKLVDLARGNGWLDLWSALIRTCARPNEFNREVRRVLDDSHLGPDATVRRLLMLTGVSREWSFPGFGFAQVQQLDDATAVKLYERFPELVRGPYRLHLQATFGSNYTKLTTLAIENDDTELVDHLASRMVTRASWFLRGEADSKLIAQLADHYRSLQADPVAFARRAAGVLTRVPAFTIFAYPQLLRDNSLARLLFERSIHDYLASPEAIADLVEGSEIHVQQLAYRALASDDERARELAVRHVELLLGTLLRPLHRRTRLAAFGALTNAAAGSREAAERIVQRAREAWDLPDTRYPKEQLVGLIGSVLHRWPELCSEAERPVVYRGGAA